MHANLISLFSLGEFPIDHILGCQPLEAVNKQFFSQPTLFVEDIVKLLKPAYGQRKPDKIARESHKTFLNETLPETLKIMKEKKPSFLVDFVFCITGSRCLPYFDGNPDFELNVMFDLESGHLPVPHTSENLLHVPWNVYNNYAEVFEKKLEKSVENALVTGFWS